MNEAACDQPTKQNENLSDKLYFLNERRININDIAAILENICDRLVPTSPKTAHEGSKSPEPCCIFEIIEVSRMGMDEAINRLGTVVHRLDKII